MARAINALVNFDDKDSVQVWLNELATAVNEFSLYQYIGTGTPEASVTAPIGSTYHRKDGGASTSFYVKESGTGNTGWVGK